MGVERRFPIQARRGTTEPSDIPWADAEIAYTAYRYLYGDRQTIERMAERGGFGWVEYLAFNDTAVWMRGNPYASTQEIHRVLDRALAARAKMHPDPNRRR